MNMFRPALLILVALASVSLAVPMTSAATQKKISTHTPASSHTSASKPKIKMAATETAIYVENMHCKTCAKKIARKLYAVKGVVKVRTNVKSNLAIITPQRKKKLDPQTLWSATAAAGFPAVRLIGPDGTYEPDPKTKGTKLRLQRTAKAKSAK